MNATIHEPRFACATRYASTTHSAGDATFRTGTGVAYHYPSALSERGTAALESLRVVGYPSDRWSPFQGPIGPHPTATLMAGLRYLSDIQHSWDVLDLGDVNRATPDYQRTRTALQVADMRFQETDDESPCIVIELQKHPIDFVASLRLVQREPIANRCG